jgi:hypothetical protein
VSTNLSKANYDMKVIREVSGQAEVTYKDAEALGDHAAHAFAGSRTNHRSQMTSLENIANSTFKTSDVFDYIKKQTARHDEWRRTYQGSNEPNIGFGERLLKYLQVELASKAKALSDSERLKIPNNTDAGQQERRRIHLLLIRQFIRQMVAQYEFASSRTIKVDGRKKGV